MFSQDSASYMFYLMLWQSLNFDRLCVVLPVFETSSDDIFGGLQF